MKLLFCLGIILDYLIRILKCLAIGIRRYPILAAVYIDTYFSLICASFYVWLDFSLTIVYSSFCQTTFYKSDKQTNGSTTTFAMIEFYGTGSKLIILQLISDIPRYLCLAYVSVKLPILLIKQFSERKSNDRRLGREQRNLLYSSLPYSTESIYVKRLLNMYRNVPTNRLATIFRRVYEWRDDFRFSSRVISVYVTIFFMLFFFTFKVIKSFFFSFS